MRVTGNKHTGPAERAAAKQAQCTVSKCNRQALLQEADAAHVARATRDTLALIRQRARTVLEYGVPPTQLPALLASEAGCQDAECSSYPPLLPPACTGSEELEERGRCRAGSFQVN